MRSNFLLIFGFFVFVLIGVVLFKRAQNSMLERQVSERYESRQNDEKRLTSVDELEEDDGSAEHEAEPCLDVDWGDTELEFDSVAEYYDVESSPSQWQMADSLERVEMNTLPATLQGNWQPHFCCMTTEGQLLRVDVDGTIRLSKEVFLDYTVRARLSVFKAGVREKNEPEMILEGGYGCGGSAIVEYYFFVDSYGNEINIDAGSARRFGHNQKRIYEIEFKKNGKLLRKDSAERCYWLDVISANEDSPVEEIEADVKVLYKEISDSIDLANQQSLPPSLQGDWHLVYSCKDKEGNIYRVDYAGKDLKGCRDHRARLSIYNQNVKAGDVPEIVLEGKDSYCAIWSDSAVCWKEVRTYCYETTVGTFVSEGGTLMVDILVTYNIGEFGCEIVFKKRGEPVLREPVHSCNWLDVISGN